MGKLSCRETVSGCQEGELDCQEEGLRCREAELGYWEEELGCREGQLDCREGALGCQDVENTRKKRLTEWNWQTTPTEKLSSAQDLLLNADVKRKRP
jgi:hypothetical protein